MTIHAFTSCSFSYLNRARVMSETLRKQHPDWTIWLVMTDKEPDGFRLNLAQEDYHRILTAEELYGEETERWLFNHDIVEACTAVKARAMAHIMAEPDCEKLFYFDPDIAVLNSMDAVVDLLDEHSIVLTPHQVEPESGELRSAVLDNEITSLDYGIFNLGFVAVANDDEARRFVQWWEERLYRWCYDRLDIGVFVDQKWCNLVPCFFKGVYILRDPGYNVASWNLSSRVMSYNADGAALINGVPLRFFHFTKLGSVGDIMTQRYARGNIEVYELWWWYRHAVERHSSDKIPKGWWYYGTFDNGVKIPKAARELFRDRKDLRAAFPAPRGSGEDSYYAWLTTQTDLLKGDDSRGFQAV